MRAVGIAVDEKIVRVDWENYIRLNTLLRYNTASDEQYMEFFEAILNPDKEKRIPAE